MRLTARSITKCQKDISHIEQNFAYGFLKIPPHDGHPCPELMDGDYKPL